MDQYFQQRLAKIYKKFKWYEQYLHIYLLEFYIFCVKIYRLLNQFKPFQVNIGGVAQ